MTTQTKRAIIIEASALKYILADEKYLVKRNFLKIFRAVDTVICCRVSPKQKAEVVKMVKDDDPEIVTLAVGDGANDVSMILEADIGVGLYGKEGLRAVDSSDFALGEF
jgi:phospholipid-transporting ATPase